MSEEINTELTSEQTAAIEKMKTAVIAFNADPRHETYKHTLGNRDAMSEYMTAHNLEWTSDALHLAFLELKKEGKLALYEESLIIRPAEPTKENTAADPAIGKATAEDLGVGFAARQQAHKTIEGVTPMRNREAFIKAAEKFASQQQSGGRRHL